MRNAGLSGYVKRRKGTTTIRVPSVRVADDLVGRDFNPQAPNRLWTSDIKYVSTWEGTLYLASVIDCYSRRWLTRLSRPGAVRRAAAGSAPVANRRHPEDARESAARDDEAEASGGEACERSGRRGAAARRVDG